MKKKNTHTRRKNTQRKKKNTQRKEKNISEDHILPLFTILIPE